MLTDSRCRLSGHVLTATPHPNNPTAGEKKVVEREAAGQHHLLGLFHDIRTAVRSAHVLLCLAGQVREREQAAAAPERPGCLSRSSLISFFSRYI